MTADLRSVEDTALERCQRALPEWRGRDHGEFRFDPPKGFSSITMGVHCRVADVDPPSILYRQLEGKQNAILDFDDERRIYLHLADEGLAAPCVAYERDHRLEQFYDGRALTAADLTDARILAGVGGQLARFHALAPELPEEPFFDRLFARWGPIARTVLIEHRHNFTEDEQAMCDELLAMVDPVTLERVRRCVPDEPLTFCHNDTYHGNAFLLADGSVRLLDFEFSCRNHRCFDVANLFAETTLRHGLAHDPHFALADPDFTRDQVGAVIDGYISGGGADRTERESLIDQTLDMVLLSDFMYAMAALPLAVEPIQKIRFIPYALARFRRFTGAWEQRFG